MNREDRDDASDSDSQSPHSDCDVAEEDGDPSRNRVVMVQDENGNAVPMLLGNFYYDNVHPSTEAAKVPEDDSRNSDDQTIRDYVPVTPEDARRKFSARVKKGILPQTRGVELSSSEESDTGSVDERVRKEVSQDEEDIYKVSRVSGNLYQDDHSLDQSEVPRKFANQFMRIEAEASKLKDVSAVRKDLNHDRQNVGSGPKIMVGIQRIISNTKDNEQVRPVPSGSREIHKSESGLQRSSSFLGGIRLSKSGKDACPGDKCGVSTLDRTRDGEVKGKRQALAAIGRALSINRNKNSIQPNGSSLKTDEKTGNDAMSNTSSLSNSNPSLGKGLNVMKNTTEIEGLDGTEDSPSQQSFASGIADRPRTSERSVGPSTVQKRTGIGQVGRLLSRNRRKSMMNVCSDQQRGEKTNTKPGENTGISFERGNTGTKPRASLSRIGRMISLKRGKQGAVENGEEAVEQNHASLKISPMSSSTVSSGGTRDASSDHKGSKDRGRESHLKLGGDARRESRLNLRSAGRMFSLTRRSGAISVGGESVVQRKTTLGDESENYGRDGSKGRKGESISAPGTSKADKFVNSEITSEAIAQSGVLGGSTHIRVAVIAIAEFSDPLSRDKWYIDVFTLPHNAVRRECMDLYDILSALARCDKNNDLCEEDMEKFEAWWRVASQFLRCYFEVERRVLFPWVDSAGAQEWEVQLALKKMRSLKDKIETLLNKVERVWNEKTFKTSAEMYGLVYKAVDEFVPRLINYFMDQEVLLPAIVKEFYTREQRVHIDKQMVDVFLNEYRQEDGNDTRHNLVLLVRWISKSRQLRAWLGKNLPAPARALYPTWYQQYEERHAMVLQGLRSRATTTITSD